MSGLKTNEIMNKKSLNLIRAGRAALAFVAVFSSLSVLSDLFLYLDGFHLLNKGLFIMKIVVVILSWGVLLDRKVSI